MTCLVCCASEEDETVVHYRITLDDASDTGEPICVKFKPPDRKVRKTALNKIGVFLVWVALFVALFFVLPIGNESQIFDPYAVLGVDEYTPISEIKHIYRELSKTNHPDHGGDPESFKEIVKAYKTLTDEKANDNWKRYGNPDGLRELHVGFAIPNWLADPKYSMFILCSYTAFFLIIPLTGCVCMCKQLIQSL